MQLKTSLGYLEDRRDDKIARGLDQPELLLTEKATGLQVLTGGNLAIQLAQMDGSYTHDVGVTANAVAEWASLLSRSSPSLLSKSKRLEIPSHRTKKFKGRLERHWHDG